MSRLCRIGRAANLSVLAICIVVIAMNLLTGKPLDLWELLAADWSLLCYLYWPDYDRWLNLEEQ